MSTARQVGIFVGAAAGGFAAWLVATLSRVTDPLALLGLGLVLGFLGAEAGHRVADEWTGEP